MDKKQFSIFLADRISKLQNYDQKVVNTLEKISYMEGTVTALKEVKNLVDEGKFDKKD